MGKIIAVDFRCHQPQFLLISMLFLLKLKYELRFFTWVRKEIKNFARMLGENFIWSFYYWRRSGRY